MFDFQNDDRKWDEWLYTLAHELRAAMLAYQDGARVVAGTHPDLEHVLLKLGILRFVYFTTLVLVMVWRQRSLSQ